MRKIYFLILTLLLLGTVSAQDATASNQEQPSSPDWQAKVASEVQRALQSQATTEFIVVLREQADLSGAHMIALKENKGAFVYHLLQSTAQRTQALLLSRLELTGVEYRPFWIANMIWVRGNQATLQSMSIAPEVAAILPNPYRRLEPPTPAIKPQTQQPSDIEWNVEQIRAPDLWDLGITGQQVVIGGQDTGYDWDHPALINGYRGWNGTTANHNYNWHDAIHSGGGVCGADSWQPCDDNGHGTHTMGTMVGDDGGANQIGVAPGAKWIGCRNMDQGVGSPTTYSECFQWFLAPTDSNGENANPALAPHVVNNSWACPPSEGCTEVTILQMVVESLRAAGIVVVASAGNSGPNCGSVQYAPAIYDATFSVGASNSNDSIAAFSSRGAVTVDGSNRIKPDVVAPGVGIRSAQVGGTYSVKSGTSMAAPHVSGLIALLISANPTLAGNVDALESVVTSSAEALTSAENCGGVSGDAIPNNTYGHGRIDAIEAYSQIQLPFKYFAPLSLWRVLP